MGGPSEKIPAPDRKIAASSTTKAIYRVADVEIDRVRAVVRRKGVVVPLRPKTYRVFLFLLDHNDRLVAKEDLIEAVWDGLAVSDDVLVRCIAELRKVLGDDPKRPRLLRTFPKMGYGLMAPVEIGDGAPDGPPDPPAPRSRAGYWLAGAAMLAAACLLMVALRTGAADRPLSEAAWWKLDRAGPVAPDASGHGMDGAVRAGVFQVKDGHGAGLSFEGPESAVRGAGRLPADNAPVTVSAWFRPSQPRVDGAAVFDYGSDSRDHLNAGHRALALLPDGRLRFGATNPASYLDGTGRIADGAWHGVAAVYDGDSSNTAHLYVDGKADASGHFHAPLRTERGGWSIGQYLMGGSPFRGAIGDVRVFDRALDAAWIAALYRCSAAIEDLGPYYFLPVYPNNVAMEGRAGGRLDVPPPHGFGLRGHPVRAAGRRLRARQPEGRRRRAGHSHFGRTPGQRRSGRAHNQRRTLLPLPPRGPRRRSDWRDLGGLLGAVAFHRRY